MTNFLSGIIIVLLLLVMTLVGQVLKQQALIIKALLNASDALRLNQETSRLVVNQLTRVGTTLTSAISHQRMLGRPN